MQRPGQTLLEVLLASAVILVGILSLVAVVLNAQIAGDVTLDEARVIQLSREAIEGARFVRDSNWLVIENGESANYYNGLRSTTDYSGIFVWDPASTDPVTALQFDFTADDSSHQSTTLYQRPEGYYTQTAATPPSTWTTTAFQRFVTLWPICSNDGLLSEQIVTADGQTCVSQFGADYVEVGVQVIVNVQWDSRGTTYDRQVEERLYNWKYAE